MASLQTPAGSHATAPWACMHEAQNEQSWRNLGTVPRAGSVGWKENPLPSAQHNHHATQLRTNTARRMIALSSCLDGLLLALCAIIAICLICSCFPHRPPDAGHQYADEYSFEADLSFSPLCATVMAPAASVVSGPMLGTNPHDAADAASSAQDVHPGDVVFAGTSSSTTLLTLQASDSLFVGLWVTLPSASPPAQAHAHSYWVRTCAIAPRRLQGLADALKGAVVVDSATLTQGACLDCVSASMNAEPTSLDGWEASYTFRPPRDLEVGLRLAQQWGKASATSLYAEPLQSTSASTSAIEWANRTCAAPLVAALDAACAAAIALPPQVLHLLPASLREYGGSARLVLATGLAAFTLPLGTMFVVIDGSALLSTLPTPPLSRGMCHGLAHTAAKDRQPSHCQPPSASCRSKGSYRLNNTNSHVGNVDRSHTQPTPGLQGLWAEVFTPAMWTRLSASLVQGQLFLQRAPVQRKEGFLWWRAREAKGWLSHVTWQALYRHFDTHNYLARNTKLWRAGENIGSIHPRAREAQVQDMLHQGLSILFSIETVRNPGGVEVLGPLLQQAEAIWTLKKPTLHVYVSPPGSQALLPHHDPYDVLVVQLHGHKHWALCHPEPPADLPAPLRSLPWTSAELCLWYTRGEVQCHNFPSNLFEVQRMTCANFTLFEGDALFIPKGLFHVAYTDNHTASTHLTVGLQSFCSWLDVLQRAIVHSPSVLLAKGKGSAEHAAFTQALHLLDASIVKLRWAHPFPCWFFSHNASSTRSPAMREMKRQFKRRLHFGGAQSYWALVLNVATTKTMLGYLPRWQLHALFRSLLRSDLFVQAASQLCGQHHI